MNGERLRIFPQTRDSILQRITKVEAKLQENTSGLGDMGDDGDSMDDPYMWKLHSEREDLDRQLLQLRGFLSSDIEIVNPNLVTEESNVSAGHQVTLDIHHSDGEREKISVIIGSTIDKQYLDKGYLKNEDHMLISDDSLLAQALLGRKRGERVTFETPNGNGNAQIIDIQIPRFIEKT